MAIDGSKPAHGEGRPGGPRRAPVGSVSRAMALLDALAEADADAGLGVNELA